MGWSRSAGREPLFQRKTGDRAREEPIDGREPLFEKIKSGWKKPEKNTDQP